ncbi:sn-glycerol-1-phosphate dehydrogenase [Pectinatus haikarae]|uniref:Glycerol-1-phosphate dehydrogenase [NAD(P)+] n=1 Tax=Pectinatus haikarae TaxID=349096 RepID=A0ABT9Y7W8_9FIRM|nr:sn-glycerol-1-phosphate dehydrogenase [Pectinatus haikarae]MDQ0203580.1 glycerol-1-phosphate dehydrogenase [NAD(P)+] [Pectinatus haikarae]
MDWNKYLNRTINCACGHTHECDIRHIDIGKNAITKLTGYVKEKSYAHICIIADVNTEKIAGKKVYAALDNADLEYDKFIFDDKDLVPDETAIGRIMTQVSDDCDLIIGIGSGTINDLCRFCSHKMGKDYFIVATAPSMDGYASDVAPLIVNNLKTTYEKVGRPKVIIGDTDILKDAPLRMITAGAGDIFGKYICLTDWQLSHIVNDEYYCPFIAEIMNEAVTAVAKAADSGIAQRDADAMGSVMEALVLAGVGMSYSGNSRPASGSEHHMSHYWEMKFLQRGEHGILHGTKVGVGTIVALHLYRYAAEILSSGSLKDFPVPEFDKAAWAEKMSEIYGPAGNGVILLEEKFGKNNCANIKKRREKVIENKEKIQELIKKLPSITETIQRMKKIEEPYRPDQIGITDDMLKIAILYAKELRNRYGLLQLLYDFGQLEKAAEAVSGQVMKLN